MPKTLSLEVGQKTDRGRKRDHNEDRVYVFQPEDPRQAEQKGAFYAVADGMGGVEAGAVAADRATRKAVEEYYYGDPTANVHASLERAIDRANAAVCELAHSDPQWATMGTTFVVAIIQDDKATIGNVGDSRAYLIHGDTIRCVTRDHRWVEEEVRAGRLTAEQAQHDSRRNLVTRSLGTQAEVQVDIFDETLEKGDALVLCSDGLHGVVRDAEICAVATRCSPQLAADELVRLANKRGGPDNISVIVLGPPRRGRVGSPAGAPLLVAVPVILVVVAALAFGTTSPPSPPPPPSPPASIATAAATTVSRPATVPAVVIRPAASQEPDLETPSPTTVRISTGALSAAGISDAVVSSVAQAPTATLIPELPRIAAPATAIATRERRPPSSTSVPAMPTPRSSERAATPTPRPSEVASPTALPPAPTVTPAPTSTPVLLVGLNLPASQPGLILLSWNTSVPLSADETFDVRAWRQDQPPGTSLANTDQYSWAIGGAFPAGDYTWTVAVIRKGDKSTVVQAGWTSTFHWAGMASGGDGKPHGACPPNC